MNWILRPASFQNYAGQFMACSFASKELVRRDWYRRAGGVACYAAHHIDPRVVVEFAATGTQLHVMVRVMGEDTLS